MIIPASLFCQRSCQSMNENVVQTVDFNPRQWMKWMYSCKILWEREARHKGFCWIHNTCHFLCCTQTLIQVPDSPSLCLPGFLLGWSVALVMPRCASGTLRQVNVYTSLWATWRRCAASSTMGGGWSVAPTTSWSKCGTLRRRPASIRCRATPTECTLYRWASSDAHSLEFVCAFVRSFRHLYTRQVIPVIK